LVHGCLKLVPANFPQELARHRAAEREVDATPTNTGVVIAM